MIRTLKLSLDSRNYREVAGLWLIGSMLGTMIGTLLGFFGVMTGWMATLPSGAASGPADFVVSLLYVARPGWGGGCTRAVVTVWRCWPAARPH